MLRFGRTFIAAAVICGSSWVSGASAEGFFESLFGGEPREGRSAYTREPERQGNPLGLGSSAPDKAATGSGQHEGRRELKRLPRGDRSAFRRHIERSTELFRRNWSRRGIVLDTIEIGHRRDFRRHVSKAVNETSTPRHDKHAADNEALPERQIPIPATPDAPQGSLAHFAKDKTLRAGDVIVTDKGFLIYRGGNRSSQKSYVALLKGGQARSNLFALEQASMRKPVPNIEVETVIPTRDFVGPRTEDQLAQETARTAVAEVR